MATHLGRRDFVAALGGAAAWPLAAHAQQPALPVIGFLNSASPGAFEPFVGAFRLGIKKTGSGSTTAAIWSNRTICPKDKSTPV
jgi:hypothetical protein